MKTQLKMDKLRILWHLIQYGTRMFQIIQSKVCKTFEKVVKTWKKIRFTLIRTTEDKVTRFTSGFRFSLMLFLLIRHSTQFSTKKVYGKVEKAIKY